MQPAAGLSLARRLQLALLLAGAAGSGCAQEGAAAEPRLVLEVAQHDFGTVPHGRALAVTVSTLNAGGGRLEVRRVSGGFGCEARAEPAVLAAGERGRLLIACQPRTHGPLREQLTVETSAGMDATLRVLGHVEPLLAFDRALLALDTRVGTAATAEVGVVGIEAARARLTVKEAGALEVRVLPGAPGQAGRIWVHARADRASTQVGEIVVTTGLARPAELRLPYRSRVVGTLTVTPTNPYFNLRERDAQRQRITLTSTEPGFRIVSATVTEGPFVAAVESAEARGDGAVVVTVDVARIPDGTRGAIGKLVIVTTDRSEPETELPLFAFGELHAERR